MQNIKKDLYLPQPARIDDVIEENSQIKTFVLSFTDKNFRESFKYEPGQFMMVSIPHCGEAPISFSSTPTLPGNIHLSVRRAGNLTGAMHSLAKGAIVGLRGPYGRSFPVHDFSTKNLLFVAGGIGLAPLKSVINTCLGKREEFGKITILYGSRSPSDIAFKEDIENWKKAPDTTCLLTVDAGDEGWNGPVGVVTSLLDKVESPPEQTIALVCGPPLMIRFALAALTTKGYQDEQIITTLERHMKCGVGICRHCHMDDKLVCVDGPVFSLAELKRHQVMELA